MSTCVVMNKKEKEQNYEFIAYSANLLLMLKINIFVIIFKM